MFEIEESAGLARLIGACQASRQPWNGVVSNLADHGIGKLVLCDWVWLRVPGCLI